MLRSGLWSVCRLVYGLDYGLSAVCLRSVCGLSAVCLRSVYGLFAVCLRSVCGLVYGLCRGLIRAKGPAVFLAQPEGLGTGCD